MSMPTTKTVHCMICGTRCGADLCEYHTTILRRSRAAYEAGQQEASDWAQWEVELRNGPWAAQNEVAA